MTDVLQRENDTPADRPALRRFTLIDAMGLIAATAVGFAGVRYSQLRFFAWDAPAAPDRRIYINFVNMSRLGYAVVPVVYALCAAVLVSGLRVRRSWREEFSHRPGMAASLAAIVAFCVAVASRLLDYSIHALPAVLRSGDYAHVLLRETSWLYLCSTEAVDALFAAAAGGAMPAILAVWMLQRLCGRWNPAPEWPDRLGRALGWFFLLWMLTAH